MDVEDQIYVTLLLGSIVFGYFYRQIHGKHGKKLIGSAVGFLIVLIVSGFHIFHTFIFIVINAVIILYGDKRKCHLVSFFFSFGYLVFFRTTEYFGIPYPPGHTNLVQMMLTLKLVGLSFDVNNAYNSKLKSDKETQQEVQIDEFDLDFLEILQYSFNFIGILTGPIVRYKTFHDYFELPFSHFVDWKGATFERIKYLPIYVVLFGIATYFWPLSYAKSDEFYMERSLLYRFWYIWPNFFIFRMRMYTGLVLSECICTMSGYGAYPDFTEPKSCHGPSKNFDQLKQLVHNQEKLRETEYSFQTVRNIYPYKTEFLPTFRESIKNWNMCVQYWLAIHIYKRFPMKKYRTFVTMLTSAVWHGVYAGHYVCLCGAPFVLPIEDVLVKLVLKGRKGFALKLAQWIMVIIKMFFFSYLSIAFHLLTLQAVIHYYNSIYHMGIIISVVIYVVGSQILKQNESPSKME